MSGGSYVLRAHAMVRLQRGKHLQFFTKDRIFIDATPSYGDSRFDDGVYVGKWEVFRSSTNGSYTSTETTRGILYYFDQTIMFAENMDSP